MSGFYTWAMRSAAAILFGIAVVLPLASIVSVLWMLTGMRPSGGDFYSPHAGAFLSGPFWVAIFSLVQSLQTAVLPLLSAAAIWRFDRWLARNPGKTE